MYLMSMQNNKSPGHNGLTKEFIVTFWDDIKNVFLILCRTAKLKKEFSASQRQTVIRIKDLLKIGNQFLYCMMITTLSLKLLHQE